MNCAYLAFTAKGLALAQQLAQTCPGSVSRCGLGGVTLAGWTAQQFAAADALVFVGAAGIAVRAIAPHCQSKATDPAVVVLDECGRFAVPLLSGHLGGANDLACRLAAACGAVPVITTATDANGVFMTSTNHINPVVSLAGRTIYVGSSLYVHFHGFGEEYTERSEELKTAYEGSSQQLKSFADENNISYIYVGNNEKQDFNINYNSLSQFEKIYDENSIQIYKVK